MKTRPKQLIVFALFLLAIAISFPIQIMIQYGHTLLEPEAILNKLSPLNWVVLAVSTFFAFLVYRASPWVWLVLPAFLFSVAWNNWLVAMVDSNTSPAVAVVATVAVFLAHSLLFTRRIRTLLSNPNLRWWQTPKRTKVSVGTKVCPVSGGELISRTFDLSESGAFITVQDVNWSPKQKVSLKHLPVGSHCSIRLSLNQYWALNCTARIVRHAKSKGQYPGGFAVKFMGMSRTDRQYLNSYLKTISEKPLTV